jgi:hypothetical protein
MAYLYSVTLAENRADGGGANTGAGGGVYVNGSATLNVINTLIAKNYLGTGTTAQDCFGPLASSGGLRIGTAADCAITGGYGLINKNSLGPLAYNGGPTMTHALLPGSEAINAGEWPSGCVDWNWNQLPTDQRGGARYAGAWCDSGAFEYGALLPRVWVPLVGR